MHMQPLFLYLIIVPSLTLSLPRISLERAVTSSSKAGLAWPNADKVDMDQFLGTGKVSWYYTWSSWPTDEGHNLEWVPQLWGRKSTSDWESNVDGQFKSRFEQGQVKAVIGFNEPQEKAQSDLSPQDAKQLWIQYLEPLRKKYGVRLGSPPTSSAPSGKNWTQDFLTACGSDCNVDFIALHWYATNSTTFIEYITDFHNTFQRPIWVTEWACHSFTDAPQCSQKQTNDFMATTQEFMDKTDWVERYSWFGAMPVPVVSAVNSLLDKDGKISPLGEQYVGELSQQANDANSSDSLNSNANFPQIGMGSPPVLPPLIAFKMLGRMIASIGIAVAVAVIAFY